MTQVIFRLWSSLIFLALHQSIHVFSNHTILLYLVQCAGTDEVAVQKDSIVADCVLESSKSEHRNTSKP